MHNNIKSILSSSPVMPVLVINKINNVENLIASLIEGNLNNIEVTLRTSCALKAIEIIANKFPELKVDHIQLQY